MYEPMKRVHAEPILIVSDDVKKAKAADYAQAIIVNGAADVFEPRAPIVPAVAPEVDDDAIKQFWGLVRQLRWANLSDGVVDFNRVKLSIKGAGPQKRAMIKAVYKQLYDDLAESFEASMLFKTHDVDMESVPRFISHFIAMGEGVYNEVKLDNSLALYFITSNECQSFDEVIREV